MEENNVNLVDEDEMLNEIFELEKKEKNFQAQIAHKEAVLTNLRRELKKRDDENRALIKEIESLENNQVHMQRLQEASNFAKLTKEKMEIIANATKRAKSVINIPRIDSLGIFEKFHKMSSYLDSVEAKYESSEKNLRVKTLFAAIQELKAELTELRQDLREAQIRADRQFETQSMETHDLITKCVQGASSNAKIGKEIKLGKRVLESIQIQISDTNLSYIEVEEYFDNLLKRHENRATMSMSPEFIESIPLPNTPLPSLPIRFLLSQSQMKPVYTTPRKSTGEVSSAANPSAIICTPKAGQPHQELINLSNDSDSSSRGGVNGQENDSEMIDASAENNGDSSGKPNSSVAIDNNTYTIDSLQSGDLDISSCELLETSPLSVQDSMSASNLELSNLADRQSAGDVVSIEETTTENVSNNKKYQSQSEIKTIRSSSQVQQQINKSQLTSQSSVALNSRDRKMPRPEIAKSRFKDAKQIPPVVPQQKLLTTPALIINKKPDNKMQQDTTVSDHSMNNTFDETGDKMSGSNGNGQNNNSSTERSGNDVSSSRTFRDVLEMEKSTSESFLFPDDVEAETFSMDDMNLEELSPPSKNGINESFNLSADDGESGNNQGSFFSSFFQSSKNNQNMNNNNDNLF